MPHVATLIAGREAFPLEKASVDALSAALNARKVSELSPGEAYDFLLERPPPSDRAALEKAGLAERPLDLVIQPANGRKKKLFVADMDSTMIEQECLDEVAAVLGLKDKIAPITEAAMQGKLDYAASLRERMKLMAGTPVTALEKVLRERIRPSEGARVLVATFKAEGIPTALVSGGLTFFVEAIGRDLGFDRTLSNRVEVIEGKLTGKVFDPIVDAQGKLAFLQNLAAELGVGLGDAAVIGDGANDIPMMKAVGMSIAYRGKPAVAGASSARLNVASLEGVLFAFGIPRSRFAK